MDVEMFSTVREVTLVRLCTEIAKATAAVGRVSVEGEVVKPLTRPSGWTYFTLADRAAKLPIACPSDFARRCRTVHGERVRVTGSLVFSSRNGQLSLHAEEVVPVGEGAIEAAIAQARGRLAVDGILDRVRRPLPLLPRRIGVVCGAEAAVRGDIESVVTARFPGYPVVFRQVIVSGPGAATAVMGGLAYLCGRSDVDVVIITRGGGDAASLLPFSDEELCRAIAASPIPVVTAIGHERDRPLCDEVSDMACPTPSLAAIAVVPDAVALRDGLDRMIDAATANVGDRVTISASAMKRDLVGTLGNRLSLASTRLSSVDISGGVPARLTHALSAMELRRDLGSVIIARSRQAGDGLALRSSQLESLSPLRVLQRGYSVVRRSDGAVVRDAAQVARGDILGVTVATGSFDVAVVNAGGS